MNEQTLRVHRSITTVERNQWNNLVAQSETGSLFQRTEWLRAVEETLDATPRHVTVERGENLVGAFPNFRVEVDLPDRLADLAPAAPTRAVSVDPGFGGPVTSSGDGEVLEQLFRGLETTADDEVVSHQLKLLDRPYLGHTALLERRGYVPSVVTCRFAVDLNRELDEIKSAMTKERRRDVRKAREQEFTVRHLDPTDEALDRFYRRYERVMDRVDGESMPRRFLSALAEYLPDRIELLSVEVDGEPAGMHLCLLDDEQDTVHYYFSGVEQSDFRYSGAELLHMDAIEWGKAEGYDRYDLGETTPDFDDGLYKYKRRYGGDPVATFSWEKGLSKGRWGLFRLGRWATERWVD